VAERGDPIGLFDHAGIQVPVLIVEGRPLVRRAIETLLFERSFDVVAAVGSAAAALALLEARADVLVLLSLHLQDMDGLLCLRAISERHAEARVVVFSISTEDADVRSALDEGARVVVHETADPEDLLTALRQAVRRSVFFQQPPADPTPARGQRRSTGLTRRELQVLQLAAEGYSNAEIASALWVAEQTVKFHLSNIYRRLGVGNRTQATRFAQLNGLLTGSLPPAFTALDGDPPPPFPQI
jgi:DNA-binding NarL/FixJ family response regulator